MLVYIGSGNGLSSIQCQTIIWTNGDKLCTEPLGTNISEILIKIQYNEFYSRKYTGKCILQNVVHFVQA